MICHQVKSLGIIVVKASCPTFEIPYGPDGTIAGVMNGEMRKRNLADNDSQSQILG